MTPSVDTPCLLLDRDKLKRNIAQMHQRLSALGVNLRPHGKTAKNIDAMRMALVGQSGGITVSTMKEAEYYLENGIRDLVYAVGISPSKLPRIAKLIQAGAEVSVLLDSDEQAQLVATAARKLSVTIPAFIEIDCDDHRAGIAPDDPQLLQIANTLHQQDGTELRGVLTHAGGSYDCCSHDQLRAMAEQERAAAVRAAERIREAGIACPVVSVGSTPTATFAEDLTGVSEVRAGVFMFQDLVMAGLGVCNTDDIAISVLTSVIGHQRSKNWLMIDAGWMALSRDRGTASQEIDQGYGLLCNANGEVLQDLIVVGTNQEHGIVAHRNGDAIDPDQFPIGTLLRVLPNHACATAAMFDRYHLIDGDYSLKSGAPPNQTWQRVNYW